MGNMPFTTTTPQGPCPSGPHWVLYYRAWQGHQKVFWTQTQPGQSCAVFRPNQKELDPNSKGIRISLQHQGGLKCLKSEWAGYSTPKCEQTASQRKLQQMVLENQSDTMRMTFHHCQAHPFRPGWAPAPHPVLGHHFLPLCKRTCPDLTAVLWLQSPSKENKSENASSPVWLTNNRQSANYFTCRRLGSPRHQ